MKLTIRRPDDFHVHLREGALLEQVLPYTQNVFARALVMPNTKNPILTADDVVSYRTEIRRARANEKTWFDPLMTIKLIDSTTPEIVAAAQRVGTIAGKLYPAGVTTNSHDGVSDIRALRSVFEEMQRVGMVLSLHGEKPGVFCLDREREFLDDLAWLAVSFPALKIVLEHVTTCEAVAAVRQYKNVAATITAHHLLLTLDDVVGDKLEPHHFCKPLPKRPQDLQALVDMATSGHPRFFFGSDSAPHRISQKECRSGCAGVFSAPVALPVLAEIFERENALSKLEAFVSQFGAKFYGLPLNQERISLTKADWGVQGICTGAGGDIEPFLAGRPVSWRVEGIEP